MTAEKKIRAALVSVYHKEGLDAIIPHLKRLNITVFSTGGTAEYLAAHGLEIEQVEQLTDYPAILGGRVKTLHPKVFGGILARQQEKTDTDQLTQYAIPPIDLVVVDLYPFEETVRHEKDEQAIIEKIDIGGISLIRAAAKNYQDVVVIPSREEYGRLTEILEQSDGNTTVELRKRLAARAFDISSHYDTAIFRHFSGDDAPSAFKASVPGAQTLRYGENPHQQGVFYGNLKERLEQLHGKPLSYNNLVDVDGALALVEAFDPAAGCTVAVIKHTNACGIATRDTLREAWKAAFAGDTISAFGGIIASNHPIDRSTAEAINEIFYEVLVAPGFDEDALEVLRKKKKRILLRQKGNFYAQKTDYALGQYKTVLNGVLAQDYDSKTEVTGDLNVVTKKKPGKKAVTDLLFANKVVKHLKSNAIALVKDQQLVGSGVGQTSRVDALKQAIEKAERFKLPLNGAVMASDAFFPFSDCVEIAHEAGITSVIQPGGSIRDQDSVDACNVHDMVMVCTGTRHFKH